VIEWMPRPRVDNGWRHVRASSYRGRAVLEERGGEPVVRVPVVVQDWVRMAVQRAGRRLAFTTRVAFFGLVFMAWLVQGAARVRGNLWPMLVATVVVVAVGIYRLLRLRRWRQGRRADLVLSPDGVAVDDLFVPWYQVERVVRFHFATIDRRGTRNFLALQVSDYVAVRGLSPFRAGLANLTRRRLVLAEAAELSHPDQLAAALGQLVADPGSRAALAGADGCRLVDEGPARAFPRSP
jgi:hypothetical protein